MRPTKDASPQEITFRDYIYENRSHHGGDTQAFYKTCTDFLKANPATSDDISSDRLEIEDILLGDLYAHPKEADKASFDEFVDAAITSFSPRMAAHIRNSPLDRLDREIASYLHQGADEEQIIDVVLRLCDVVHVAAKLPPIMTTRGVFGAHDSFIKMVESLPETKRDYMKATITSLLSWDVIMSQQLYRALGINETKKNPPTTNLVKRGKLTVREGFAVLSRSGLSQFFGTLLETTDQEFARAGEKIGASSYAADVHHAELRKHYDQSPKLGS